MRIKKDSIFNSDILALTAHLSREDFGILITMAMIEDDKYTEKRYENLSDIFLNSYMNKEEEWKEQFNQIVKNPINMSAYNVIYGSAAKSRKGYDELKAKIDAKNGNTDGNETDTIIPSVEENTNILTESFSFKGKSKPIVIKFTTDTVENAPNQRDIDELADSFDDDTIIKMLVRGNIEKWQRHYDDILMELTKKGESENVQNSNN